MGKKRNNPDTSHAAYVQAEDIITPQQKDVIKALRVLHKAIVEEMATYIGVHKSVVHRRTSELEESQLIFTNGEVRKTSANRDAQVYILTEKGKTVDLGPDFPTPPVVERIRQKKSKVVVKKQNQSQINLF